MLLVRARSAGLPVFCFAVGTAIKAAFPREIAVIVTAVREFVRARHVRRSLALTFAHSVAVDARQSPNLKCGPFAFEASRKHLNLHWNDASAPQLTKQSNRPRAARPHA
jgi:hypothetical protein